jgi:conjugal transfer pilus assembly protein TraE
MKADIHQQNATKFLSQRNAIAIVSGVQSLSMAVLIVALACKSERTILMPPEIKREMWFQGGNVSVSYLESLGEYISKLLLDITPSSFVHNHEQILKYATPEAYGSLKKQLMSDGEQYTKLQLSTHFYPNQLTVNQKTLEVEVKGTLTSYIAGNKVQDTQETITLKFTHRGTGILLDSVLQNGNDAGLQK